MNKKKWIRLVTLVCIVLGIYGYLKVQTKEEVIKGFLNGYYQMEEQEVHDFRNFKSEWYHASETINWEQVLFYYQYAGQIAAEEGYQVYCKKIQKYSTPKAIEFFFKSTPFDIAYKHGVVEMSLSELKLVEISDYCFEYHGIVSVLDKENKSNDYKTQGKVWLYKEDGHWYVNSFIEEEGFFVEGDML